MTDMPLAPRIGLTMGDPAGIGPEICVKALAVDGLRFGFDTVVIGDLQLLRRTAADLKIELRFVSPDDGCEDGISVIEPLKLNEKILPGAASTESGRASASYIGKAFELWRDGKIDAITTGPISKQAIAMAGHHYPGHTEFLAHLSGAQKVAMSFFAGALRIVLLSTHLSLYDAIALVKADKIAELVRFSNIELRKLLGGSPKIAVAGLNPHASEGGMFGKEEQLEIGPAIEICKAEGIDVNGPHSPDTVFLRGFRGEFDAVIALYHDQATIPVKALSFGAAVNVTLGLPLIRTSVDHGTAFDIAGRGIADESSMVAAIKVAAELVRRRRGDSKVDS